MERIRKVLQTYLIENLGNKKRSDVNVMVNHHCPHSKHCHLGVYFFLNHNVHHQNCHALGVYTPCSENFQTYPQAPNVNRARLCQQIQSFSQGAASFSIHPGPQFGDPTKGLVLKGDSEPPRSGLFESGCWMDWIFQKHTVETMILPSIRESEFQPILGPLGCLKYSVKGMCSNMMSSSKATTNLFCAAYIEFPCATFGAEILSF